MDTSYQEKMSEFQAYEKELKNVINELKTAKIAEKILKMVSFDNIVTTDQLNPHQDFTIKY